MYYGTAGGEVTTRKYAAAGRLKMQTALNGRQDGSTGAGHQWGVQPGKRAKSVLRVRAQIVRKWMFDWMYIKSKEMGSRDKMFYGLKYSSSVVN